LHENYCVQAAEMAVTAKIIHLYRVGPGHEFGHNGRAAATWLVSASNPLIKLQSIPS